MYRCNISNNQIFEFNKYKEKQNKSVKNFIILK